MTNLNPNLVGTLYKLDSEDFDASVDFSNWLTSGDTIDTNSVKCYQDSTDVSSTMIGTTSDDSDDEVTFQVKSGVAGTQYLIEVTANTTNGDVWVAQLNLVVN